MKKPKKGRINKFEIDTEIRSIEEQPLNTPQAIRGRTMNTLSNKINGNSTTVESKKRNCRVKIKRIRQCSTSPSPDIPRRRARFVTSTEKKEAAAVSSDDNSIHNNFVSTSQMQDIYYNQEDSAIVSDYDGQEKIGELIEQILDEILEYNANGRPFDQKVYENFIIQYIEQRKENTIILMQMFTIKLTEHITVSLLTSAPEGQYIPGRYK